MSNTTYLPDIFPLPPFDFNDTSDHESFENTHQFGGWNEIVHRSIDWSSQRSGKNNSMYGKKRAGTFSEECLEKKRQSMMGKNTCRVQIHGVEYLSVGKAENAHPNVKVRYRLDNPKYTDWIRLDKKRNYSS